MRDALVDGMRGQERLAGVGVEVCDVRVLSLRPEADIEKALQTPAARAAPDRSRPRPL